MENKVIGGISLERWKEAFGQLVDIAIDHDDFSDILFFDLYPNTHEEAAQIDEEDEEAICDVYNSKWAFVDEAFKEIFNFSRHE